MRYIYQLIFEIEVNSGRIFTEPRSGEVNILPLFTEIEKNNCFSIYTGSDLNNIFRNPLKIDPSLNACVEKSGTKHDLATHLLGRGWMLISQR